MNISERILLLLIGCMVGFVLGYIVRSLRIIEIKLDRVEKINRMMKSDEGVVTHRVLWNSALLIVVLLTAFSSFKSQEATNNSDNAVKKVNSSAVVSCQNANETREANLALWKFVINTSVASQPNPTKKQTRNIEAIRDWIEKVYQDHDCNNLTKKYPIPPPPKIIPNR